MTTTSPLPAQIEQRLQKLTDDFILRYLQAMQDWGAREMEDIRKKYDDDVREILQEALEEKELMEVCPGCRGEKSWLSECCDGSGGCPCHGQPYFPCTCDTCGGTGVVPKALGAEEKKECPVCNGDGETIEYERDEFDRGVGLTKEPCGRCSGTGKLKEEPEEKKEVQCLCGHSEKEHFTKEENKERPCYLTQTCSCESFKAEEKKEARICPKCKKCLTNDGVCDYCKEELVPNATESPKPLTSESECQQKGENWREELEKLCHKKAPFGKSHCEECFKRVSKFVERLLKEQALHLEKVHYEDGYRVGYEAGSEESLAGERHRHEKERSEIKEKFEDLLRNSEKRSSELGCGQGGYEYGIEDCVKILF